MNSKEKKYIENIEGAKKKIKKAKSDYSTTITYMNNLISFIEENIKVNSVKNLRSEVDQYKKQMNKNNENIDILVSRLDKHKEKIKEIAKLRKEAENFGK